VLDRADDLLAAYHALDFPLDRGHIHGDAYPGNLLWDGPRALLGDWDETSTGPRELDLVNTYQGVRFGRTEQQLDEFANAYGYDLTRWPGFTVLRSIRDLHTLGTYLYRGNQGDETARHQVTRRLETLRHDDLTARWGTG
jgi:aminoglycoside phosphotransferase (APT) family kinase protein